MPKPLTVSVAPDAHEGMVIEEVLDSETCDVQIWFARGHHPDDRFLAALELHQPDWRRLFVRLSFTSEQLAAAVPVVQRGTWKRAFGRYGDAHQDERAAFPVTFVRVR